MPLLCLDTSTDAPVAALTDDAGALRAGARLDARAQAVLVAVEQVLAEHGRADVRGVVVGIGPGTFTGLRVGVSTARGIAETLGVPLVQVSSLAAAAASVGAPEGSTVQASIAAGRGEHFVQPFEVGADGDVAPVGEQRAVSAEEAPALTPITPEGLARAAAARWRVAQGAGEAGDPLRVVPRYGREPDAEPPRMEVGYGELDGSDLDALVALEHRCFNHPWSRAMYVEELARPEDQRVLLAARDMGANRRLVGAALAARIGDGWHVMNILVDPVARRRGIASVLLGQLIERTSGLGAGEGWTLEVRDDNDGAIGLYERHGFHVAGRRPGYYQDTGQDALVMWRHAGERSEAPA